MLEDLIQQLKSKDIEQCQIALQQLGEMAQKEDVNINIAVPELLALLGNTTGHSLASVLWVLGYTTDLSVIESVRSVLIAEERHSTQNRDYDVINKARLALNRLEGIRASQEERDQVKRLERELELEHIKLHQYSITRHDEEIFALSNGNLNNMEFIKIQHDLVKLLVKIPIMETFGGRSSLLHGLPNLDLIRSETSAQLDLNNIISGFNNVGRLTDQGGVRPVIVIVDNALSYVPDGVELAHHLQRIKKQLEGHYGGDIQPEPEQPITDKMFEALIFGQRQDTRVQFAFIQQAQIIANSIARLTVPRYFNGSPDGKVMYGTSWIIAPGILITNHHVIEARDRRPQPIGRGEQPAKASDFELQAQRLIARFDYQVEREDGSYTEYRNARLLAANRTLDYAVIELEQANMMIDRKPITIVPKQPTLTRGARMNIVQHPQGGPLHYAIRNNFFVRSADEPSFLFYQTDTEPGASGSPVCNDDWQVIALHHASRVVPSERVPQEVLDGEPIKVMVLNEAINIHAILKHLPKEVFQRVVESQKIE